MAKIIGALKFVGKFNDAVGMRSTRGKNFVRSAAANVSNPRTVGQCIQRMILATAGQSIGYLKEICNNSVEGKANGNETLSYLRSQWMRMLRVSDIDNSPYNYAKKGIGYFVANPYLLAKGSIWAPRIACNGSNSRLECADIRVPATKASELFPTIAVGNQITIVSVALDDRELVEDGGVPNIVKYCRFAFKDDTTAPLIVDGSQNLVLNPAAIDLKKAAGDWQKLQFVEGGIILAALNDDLDLAACALIVSNIENKQRSTSYLTLAENILGEQWPASQAYPTFGNLATPIDVPSEVYLDNSAVVGGSNSVKLLNAPLVGAAGVSTSGTIDGGSWSGAPQVSLLKLNVRVTSPTQGDKQYTSKNLIGLDSGGAIINGVSTIVFVEVVPNLDGTIDFTVEGTQGADAYIITGGSCIVNNVAYTF